jgi:hypothetical protein
MREGDQFMLRFDYLVGEAMSQIPAGATIHAAVLEMTSAASNASGDGGTFHTMLTDGPIRIPGIRWWTV